MNITPLRDRIVVEPIEQELKSAGGILLTEKMVEKPFTGVVRAVGEWSSMPNGDIKTPTIQKGWIVAYRKGAGTEIPGDDGKVYLVCHEDEIVCVVGQEKVNDND